MISDYETLSLKKAATNQILLFEIYNNPSPMRESATTKYLVIFAVTAMGTGMATKLLGLLLVAVVVYPLVKHKPSAVSAPNFNVHTHRLSTTTSNGAVRKTKSSTFATSPNKTNNTTAESRSKLLGKEWQAQRLVGRKLFFAANLHNNEEVLNKSWIPNVVKTLKVLLDLGVKKEDMFVSVYESGSTDYTGLWLHYFIRALQFDLQVPYSVIQGGTAEQRVVMPTWNKLPDRAKMWRGQTAKWQIHVQSRIIPLAEMRNEALKPLLNSTVEYTDLLFLNDVFFVPEDLLRLLAYRTLETPPRLRAELACGLDLVDGYMGERLWFYDTWVQRDSDGFFTQNEVPFLGNPHHAARLLEGKVCVLLSNTPQQHCAARSHTFSLS